MPTVNPNLTQRQHAAPAAYAGAPPPLNVTGYQQQTNQVQNSRAAALPGGQTGFNPPQPIVEVDPSNRSTWPSAPGGLAFSPTPSVSGV